MEQKASSSQEAAIRHRDGPALVLAGPGSGKTFVLTQRLRFLTEECGIPPGDILTITFTNAAAAQMKERAMQLIPKKACQITFGTFHSVFFLILKHTFNLTSQNILSASLKNRIMNEIIKKLDIKTCDRETLIADLTSFISSKKNGFDNENPAMITDEEAQSVFKLYNDRLKKNRLLDFDDMILKCRELFIKRPAVLNRFQNRYRYICVDEFQDVNPIQYEVLCMLSGKSDNLFVVGDDDQAIYGFRGSSPGIMMTFLKEHEGAKQYGLFTNYRSANVIVEASVNVIGCNKNRLSKDISAFDTTGGKVILNGFPDRSKQLDNMAQYIREGLRDGGYEDFAILLRTNTPAFYYSSGLSARGIRCRIRGRSSDVFSSGVGRDILNYMKLAMGDKSRGVFLGVMNSPQRGIPRYMLDEENVDIKKLIEACGEDDRICDDLKKLEFDIGKMSSMKPCMAMHYLLNVTGYGEHMKKKAGKDERLYTAMKDTYDLIMEEAKEYNTIKQWTEHILSDERPADEKGVLITTMHSCKGLEFMKVLIPDANEGVIPGKKCILPYQTEEERRLFYVAMTRARKELFISYVEEGRGRKMYPSRFVNEIYSSSSPAISSNSRESRYSSNASVTFS